VWHALKTTQTAQLVLENHFTPRRIRIGGNAYRNSGEIKRNLSFLNAPLRNLQLLEI
jgi:hypothetical protein